MKYHLARIKIFFSRFFERILDFSEAVSYHTRKSIHLIRNHERTKNAGYHISRASKKLVYGSIDNLRNWSDRMDSSENFRIGDEDV